jgi:AcrR family transcriptional regulator
MSRTYRARKRARTEEETRLRIVEAAIHLHESVGDKHTTVSAIAELAGVGRVTVYRHFPDERALLTACTSHYFGLNPPPDPASWAGIADPELRLRSALTELYPFYRRNEGMLTRAEQDAPTNPILAELLVPFIDYQAGIRDLMVAGFAVSGQPADPLMTAAVGHALAFGTWRSLTRVQGLDDEQAVTVMLTLIRCVFRSCESAT